MEMVYKENPDRTDALFLEQELMRFNASRVKGYAYEDFLIKVLDEPGEILGGVQGQAGGGWLYIQSLWVRRDHRGKGMGRRLLDLAEKQGINKKCHGAYLYTYTFQAQEFYEKSGYRVFGKLDRFCGSHARLFMKKDLH